MMFKALKSVFRTAGCSRLIVKPLAPNDNSKNQVYFGPDFQAVNLLPHGNVIADGSRFKAPLDFHWMDASGVLSVAPHSQLILYPQYPEVRFSGFLRGSKNAPKELMASRLQDRILLLGLGDSNRVIGHVIGGQSPLRNQIVDEIRSGRDIPIGVFHELSLSESGRDPVRDLLATLGRVHQLGWIGGQILRSDGTITPTNAANACGYTLESMLGVSANSAADPDFQGWELKSLTVKQLGSVPLSHRMTLMTPEPKAGIYRDQGVLEFVRTYGYPDKSGIPDRLNFGGQFRVGQREPNTGLTMVLDGYSAAPGEVSGRIDTPTGGLVLRDDFGNVAAMWPYPELISHWNRKHARAAYVPAISRIENGERQFKFDRQVFLGVQTDFLRFLGSMNLGQIVYDPGIKVEGNSTSTPITKRRSQFRTKFEHLSLLYAAFEIQPVSLASAADVESPSFSGFG